MRRALSSLAEAGVLRYQPARRTRGLVMLDEQPATRLRIRPQDLARRAALEQRKLREMISFCYTENCYRTFILDYFGDRSHEGVCGKCGNCLCTVGARRLPKRTTPSKTSLPTSPLNSTGTNVRRQAQRPHGLRRARVSRRRSTHRATSTASS